MSELMRQLKAAMTDLENSERQLRMQLNEFKLMQDEIAAKAILIADDQAALRQLASHTMVIASDFALRREASLLKLRKAQLHLKAVEENFIASVGVKVVTKEESLELARARVKRHQSKL